MIFRLKNQDRINKAFKGEWVELDCWAILQGWRNRKNLRLARLYKNET